MYILNTNYIFYDASDLNIPQLFLLEFDSHNTYIMESETRLAFLEVLGNKEGASDYYESFKEYGFFKEV